ncbi:divalent metal cation transporter [Candidatus Gottesmanbacteria bacterium RIFCSPHIGHO2_02_FULL_39_11]|uniref:Divalent metal cation transporter MntH n=1 Tax=Candidatus Gottesmanbacteria bacterium RIFCSPHIGHO2_02_FULL_39_11 TaxID=1798382 RepID=A0A1F5ZX05_9BACT|nr:MAG: divalent metal cation transporter [Candidatus Gottesmanbacteria bacterium RIFCSPHIGHO2_02_FULL_39_11]
MSPKNKDNHAYRVVENGVVNIFSLVPFLGPAFIASVAYIDPGNFATNIQSGSMFGYKLIWVVVMANLMAMLFQMLSAKLGLATGYNLAELSRMHFKKPVVIGMWLSAEIAAMATDLAELLGSAIAIHLLFGIPLVYGALITGLIVFAVLTLDNYGYRPLEIVIAGLVGVIAVCYVVETFLSQPDWKEVGYHAVVPWLGGSQSIFLAVGIIGATVMPHVLYLHSSLTQSRVIPKNNLEKRRLFHLTLPDVVIAMGLAGLINISMLYMAAATFNAHGKTDIADIYTAYKTLTPLFGNAASTIFAISLLVSGISSSVVGTMSGQVIMQGFVGFKIPIFIRRLATMVPTFIIIFLGINSTHALVLSQVILSMVLPIPIITLIYLTRRHDVMGILTNKSATTYLAIIFGSVIVLLNLWLIAETFIPFLK